MTNLDESKEVWNYRTHPLEVVHIIWIKSLIKHNHTPPVIARIMKHAQNFAKLLSLGQPRQFLEVTLTMHINNKYGSLISVLQIFF
jgi:VanZ family protein